MRLIKYEYLEDVELYEFTYDHKHRGIQQELKFRYPEKDTGPAVYKAWCKAANERANEELANQIKGLLEDMKEAEIKPEKLNDDPKPQ